MPGGMIRLMKQTDKSIVHLTKQLICSFGTFPQTNSGVRIRFTKIASFL